MYPPRKTHRRRGSALRLSSDTTSTLPEYIPTTAYHRHDIDAIPSDRPPDYPDSAEEADEDTDSDSPNTIYVPPPLSPSASSNYSPRAFSSPRRKRFPTHKRRQPTDPYLDSLLERSVHALEISNTLLQSSMSTQSSLSNILTTDSPADKSLEARAQVLSSRIQGSWEAQETWADDLQEINRTVESLFGEEATARPRKISEEGSVSCSLPVSVSPLQHKPRAKRQSSLDLRKDSETGLQLSPHPVRANFISPPPRALTQYVESTQDPETITLPSTLGHRSSHPSATSLSSSDWRPLHELASSSTTSLHALPSLPALTERTVEPSTPAYNMLASFVYKPPSSGSATPSSSFTSSFMRPRRGRGSSAGSNNSERTTHKRSPERCRSEGSGSTGTPSIRHSRSQTPKRTMTPPAEESSSSSDGYVAKRTIVSLRKILDDQPKPKSPSPSPSAKRLRVPAFMPRTPAPVAEAGTSTATASISRLFTKGTHSSSARAPSPPRQSAMKRPSPTTSPIIPSSTTSARSSSSTLSMLNAGGLVVAKAFGGSTPSSGRSTPKRISFAELPESYASTRPVGAPSKFKEKRRRSGEGRGKGKGREGVGGGEGGGWLSGWLGGASVGISVARQEERMEDRMSRSWGARMATGLDEWAV